MTCSRTSPSFTQVCDGRESGAMEGRACLVDNAVLIADGTTTGAELRELRPHEVLHVLARDCAGFDASDHIDGIFVPAQANESYVLRGFE